jgi:hypothetical protein
LFGQILYETQINPLIQKEFVVIEGRAPVERAFNGRMFRWLNYYEWWQDMDSFSQVFGVSTSGFDKSHIMVSGNTHNDFIRLFFLTGLPGLIAYVTFLFGTFKIGFKQQRDKMFLIVGAVIIMFLYSMSALPTLYSPLLYFIIPIFVYALKLKKLNRLYEAKKTYMYTGETPATILRSGNSN